jgi:hypothetical protein
MCEAGSLSLSLSLNLKKVNSSNSTHLTIYFYVYSGFQEILQHQFPMQHSHAMARWCMPAFWMDLSLYLMPQIFSYIVRLIQLPTFSPLQGKALSWNKLETQKLSNLIHL